MKLSDLNERQKMWPTKEIRITAEVGGKVVELDYEFCSTTELRLKVRPGMTPDQILNSPDLSQRQKEEALVNWLRQGLKNNNNGGK